MWSKDFYERLTSDDLAKGVTEAERLLASHKERKVCMYKLINMYVAVHFPTQGELDSRQENFNRITKKGEVCIQVLKPQ